MRLATKPKSLCWMPGGRAVLWSVCDFRCRSVSKCVLDDVLDIFGEQICKVQKRFEFRCSKLRQDAVGQPVWIVSGPIFSARNILFHPNKLEGPWLYYKSKCFLLTQRAVVFCGKIHTMDIHSLLPVDYRGPGYFWGRSWLRVYSHVAAYPHQKILKTPMFSEYYCTIIVNSCIEKDSKTA